MLDRLGRRVVLVVASVMAALLVTVALPVMTPAYAGSASISAVYFSGGSSSPTVTVIGSGFGTVSDLGAAEDPSTYGATCAGNLGEDYAGNLWLTDSSSSFAWNAGAGQPQQSDYIGLVISSYSDTEIVFTFGSCYVSYGVLSAGDPFTMNVLGTSLSGTVEYPSISGVSFSGSSSSPTVTVSGSGFGTESALGTAVSPSTYSASCGGNLGEDYPGTLYLTDSTDAWNAGAGEPFQSDYIGLVISSYSNTEIVFTFGSCYPSYGVLSAGDSFTMHVLGASLSGAVYYPAPDGSGAMSVSPNVVSTTSANTLTFTYTAGAGGVFGGSLQVAVPPGWSAPTPSSVTTNAAGAVVSVASSVISVTGLTLGAGANASVVDSDAVAPSTTGAYTFATSEASTPSGTLTSLATSPVVDVASTPSPPTIAQVIPEDGFVTVVWSPPSSTGGSPLTGYEVFDGTSPGGEGTSPVASVGGSTTGANVSGLTDGQTYYFTVEAVNAVGSSSPSNEVGATPQPQSVPAEPILFATPLNTTGEIELEWSVGSGIHVDGYDLYRSTTGTPSTSGTPYQTFSSAQNGYIDTGLTPGETYYYALTAYNILGQSTPASYSAAATGPPAAPAQLSALAGNGQVTLSWSAPSDNGQAIQEYFIYEVNPQGAPVYQQVGAVGGSTTTWNSAAVLSLANGTTYSFAITAENLLGLSPYSPVVGVTPLTTPGQPTELTASRGDAQATLSWVAPASDGGGSITGYDVYEGTSSGGESATPLAFVPAGSGPTSAYTANGLTDGTEYYFTVAAVNAAGAGPASGEAAATPITVPGVPTALSATSGNGQVSLSWSAPSFAGGSTITQYDIFEGTSSGAEGGSAVAYATQTVAQQQAGQPPTPAATVTGLTNGKPYYFTVQAVNSAGTSLSSGEVLAVPATTPSAPAVSVQSSGNGQVVLAWTAPASGGSPITGYDVYEGTSSGKESATPVLLATGTQSSAAVTGLTDGTAYFFTVAAVNAVGTGASSNEVSATPLGAPSAPSGLGATAGNGTVTLSWTAPASNGGSAITGYQVLEGTSAGAEAAAPVSSPAAGTTSVTLSGLANNATLWFEVDAVNAVGTSAVSNEIGATPSAALGTPDLVVTSASSGQVSLEWSVPATGAGTLTGYDVYEGTTSGGEGTTPIATPGPSTNASTVSGLTNGKTYFFAVAAVVSGTSVTSNEVSVTPRANATPPGAPGNLTAAPGNGSVTLLWTPPSVNGSSPITGYDIYEGTSSGGEGTVAVASAPAGPAPNYTVTGLSNGTPYYFTVAAVTAPVVGANSAEVSATPATVAGTPTNLVATPGNAQVGLTWSAPLSNGGAAIEGYEVYDGTQQGGLSSTPVAFVTGTSASVSTLANGTSLANGTAYVFSVQAVNAAGASASATSATATPAKPTVSVSLSDSAQVAAAQSVPDSAIPASAITWPTGASGASGATGASTSSGGDASSASIGTVALTSPGGAPLTSPGGAALTSPGGAPLTSPGGAALTSPGGAPLTSPGGAGLLAAPVGTLPLAGIAGQSSSSDPGIEAAISALKGITLADLPISYPPGCTEGSSASSCQGWSGVLQGSDLADAPLESTSLYDVLTDTSDTDHLSQSGTPETPAQVLDGAAIGDLGLSGSTFGSLPAAAFAFGATPIDDIPPVDDTAGASVTPGSTQSQQDALTGWCELLAALPNNSYTCASFGIASDTDTTDAASVNLFTLTLAGIPLTSPGGAALTSPGGAPLTSPGGAFIGSTLLSEIPLTSPGGAALTSPGGAPLTTVPLSELDFSDSAFGSIPLDAIPSLPEGGAADPLGNVTIGSLALTSPGGAPLTSPGGAALTSPGGAPLTSPGGAALTSPGGAPLTSPGGAGLGGLPIESIGLGTSSEAALSAVPLNSVESLDFSSVPLSDVDLAPSSSDQLGSIDLGQLSLGSGPIASIGLDSLTLGALPSGTIGSIALTSPGGAPLTSPGGAPLVNCSLITCSSSTTLAEAEAAGAIYPTSTLGELIAAVGSSNADVTGTDLAQLGYYGQATLADLLAEVQQSALADVAGTTLGGLGFWGSVTLGALIDAIQSAISSGNFTGSVLQVLNQALTTPISALGSYGSTTLSELLAELPDGTQWAYCTTSDPTVGVDCPSVEQILEGDTTSTPGYPLLTLDDLLLALEPPVSYPWPSINLADVPVAASSVPLESSSSSSAGPTTDQFSATIHLTGNGGSVQVIAQLPDGFSYLPSSSTLDGSALGDPTIGQTTSGATDEALEWTIPLTSGTHTVDFDALAGTGLGAAATTVTVALAGLPNDLASASATSTVTDGLANDSASSATTLSTGTLNLGYLTPGEDANDWSIDVTSGQELALSLSNLPAQYDLALFAPTSAGDNTALQPSAASEAAPVTDAVPSFGSAATVEATPGSADIPITPPAGYQLYALSNDGAVDTSQQPQTIQTPPLGGGTYIVQVSGYNGASSAQPYVLQAQLLGAGSPLICAAPSWPNVASGSTPEATFSPPAQPSTVPTGTNTLFLVDTQRLQAAFGPSGESAILGELDTVAADSQWGVQGAVVAVDSYQAVENAYLAWDEDPCSVQAANGVVAAIDALVDSIRVNDPGVANIVIVGADDQIPFARLIDGTVVSNERDYASALFAGDNNVEAVALGLGYYFSDDPFAASPTSTVEVGGETLYLPTAGVGRLVESESDIMGTLERFDQYGNDIGADTGLSTGYAFLTNGSDLVSANLAQAGVSMSDLINDSWQVSDLSSALDTPLSSGGPTVVSLNAHFDYSRALSAAGDAADSTDPSYIFGTADVAADSADYEGRLLFSMGCHAGLDINPVETGVSVPDWATTFAESGSLWVANTGFGYGDTNEIAYSTAVMANLAGDLNQPISVGQALAEAVQQYAAGEALLSPYDVKAMMESTLYGLPMYGVTTPDSASGSSSSGSTTNGMLRAELHAAPPAAAGARPQALRAAPSSTTAPGSVSVGSIGTDSATGLTDLSVSATLPVSPSGNQPSSDDLVPVCAPSTATCATTSYAVQTAGGLDAQATEYRPVEPKLSVNVSESGLVAHGALITGLSSQDVRGTSSGAPNFDPTISNASADTPAAATAVGTAAYPGALDRVGPGVALSASGLGNELDLVAGQFIPDAALPGLGVQRLFTQLSSEVLYTSATGQYASDVTPPTIDSTTGAVVGSGSSGSLQFRVTVTPGGAPVKEVLVLYTDAANPGTWSSVQLSPNGGGTVWTVPSGTTLAPTASGSVTFFTQVVDAAGYVAMSNNDATLFTASGGAPVSISLSGTKASNGNYVTPVSAQVSLLPGASTPASYTLTSTTSSPQSGALPQGGTIFATSSGTYSLTVTTTDPLDVTTSDSTGSVTSSPVSFTIALPAPSATPTSTSLVSSADPAGYGQTVTLTATVSPEPDSGTVAFRDGSSTLGTVTLTGPVAVLHTSSIAEGSHSITASYAGDASFEASTSGALKLVVAQPLTTTSLTSSTDPAVTGQSVTYKASVAMVAPAIGTPTGAVTFSDGGSAIASCKGVALSAGSASCAISYSSTGSHTITAAYTGAGAGAGTASTSGALSEYIDTNLSSYKTLAGANLSGAYLVDANLAGKNLSGANLSKVNFLGANLQGANLQGANLQKAELGQANLSGATLQGDNLAGDDLTGANLSAANLQGSDLAGVTASGADFVGASLQGDNMSSGNFSLDSFTGDNLQGTDLASADLLGDQLANATLQGSNLAGATLTDAVMSSDNLQGANLSNVQASGVTLTGATLTGADLQGATLVAAIFTGANLQGANVSSANLTSAQLTQANLTGANFSSSVLTNASLLGSAATGANFSKVTWSNTTCPDGTNSNNDKGTCVNDLTPQAKPHFMRPGAHGRNVRPAPGHSPVRARLWWELWW